MICTEILVDGTIFEHVVDGGEHGSGDGTDGFLPPGDCEYAGTELGNRFPLCFLAACALDDGRLEPLRTAFEAGSIGVFRCSRLCADKRQPRTADVRR